jgi:hypothetical protein
MPRRYDNGLKTIRSLEGRPMGQSARRKKLPAKRNLNIAAVSPSTVQAQILGLVARARCCTDAYRPHVVRMLERTLKAVFNEATFDLQTQGEIIRAVRAFSRPSADHKALAVGLRRIIIDYLGRLAEVKDLGSPLRKVPTTKKERKRLGRTVVASRSVYAISSGLPTLGKRRR